MRKPRSYNPIFDEGEDSIPIGAFAWPPKSYSCRFCKREFRSAQALGGHMNVHRMDRARLRHLPLCNLPTLEDPQTNTNPNPNPNPNHVSHVPRNHDSCPHLFPSNTCKSLMPKSMKFLLCVEEMEVVVRHGYHLSRREDVRVDMEVGSRGDVLEDDVDLELRLGYG